jgi:hypothetical protein
MGLVALACASSPQEESTALAEPEPRPLEEPVEAPMPASEAAPEAGEAAAPTASPAPTSPASVHASLTGIPVCDEYLSLYQRCEAYLEPQIMAGDRRSYAAEAASLRYFLGTPEAAALPESCRAMHDALRVDCPEPHRRPPEPIP